MNDPQDVLSGVLAELQRAQRLLAKHNGRTRYKIFYCNGHVRDRNYAERLQHLPGVELCPQPGTTHNVIQAIYESGRLGEIFDSPPSSAAVE